MTKIQELQYLHQILETQKSNTVDFVKFFLESTKISNSEEEIQELLDFVKSQAEIIKTIQKSIKLIK